MRTGSICGVFLIVLIVGAAVGSGAENETASPEVVVLDSIADWFGAVEFSHGMHAEIADDCESCHHHSDGEAVPCATCHEAEVTVASTELPNLNLAYHLGCVPCHESVDGPTGCEDCHQRKRLPEGPALLWGSKD